VFSFARTFLIAFGALAAARVGLPPAIEHYVNRTLDRHGDYSGRIGHVRLDLWRGAYVIEGLELRKRSGEDAVPFLSMRSVDFSVQWSGLLHGAIVGEVRFDRPEMNLVLAPEGKDEVPRKEEEKQPERGRQQTKIDPQWQQTLLELFPFKIDQIEVANGSIRFRDLRQKPIVDVAFVDLQVRIRNLTNIRGKKQKGVQKGVKDAELPATVEMTARTMRTASFWLDLRVDPFATRPTFDLDAALQGVDLVRINDFLRAYANLDVERGKLHVFTEIAASEGRVTGYVKPFFEDLELVGLHEIRGPRGLLHAAWEGMAGAMASLFKNQKSDRVATRIPIEGTLDVARTDLSTSIAALLSNAFVRALKPGVEGTIDVGSAEKKQTREEEKSRERSERKKKEQERSAGDGDAKAQR
jgi:hypothetical protein